MEISWEDLNGKSLREVENRQIWILKQTFKLKLLNRWFKQLTKYRCVKPIQNQVYLELILISFSISKINISQKYSLIVLYWIEKLFKVLWFTREVHVIIQSMLSKLVLLEILVMLVNTDKYTRISRLNLKGLGRNHRSLGGVRGSWRLIGIGTGEYYLRDRP